MRILLVFAALTAFVGGLLAAPPEHLNFGKQLAASQCTPGTGKLVINVVQQVTNDADSGFTTPVWAFDDLTRQIQVWQTGATTFCGSLKYQGSWTTIAGPSPSGAGTIAAGITGTFEGGYTVAITGTLKANPSAKTKGNIGSVDYACDNTGNCPGAAFWADLYFDTSDAGFSFSQPFWGWIYHGGNNGTWVNASTGSSGDIHN